MRPKPQIPAEIEEYRDERWRREATRQVETALDAERFIEQIELDAGYRFAVKRIPKLTRWPPRLFAFAKNAGALLFAFTIR